METPILVGSDGQATEIIDEFKSGIFFAVLNSEHFIESVKKMSKRGNKCFKMSENSLIPAKKYDRKN